MKNHLFCIGVELRKTGQSAETADNQTPASSFTNFNVYVGANDLHEALSRVQQQLQQDGYEILFIRGGWVVDANCNDGFCPTDAMMGSQGGDLLFNGQIAYGKPQEWSINSEYEY